MLRELFDLFRTPRPAADLRDDCIWHSGLLRREGIRRETEASLGEGRSTLILAVDATEIAHLAAILAAHHPLDCRRPGFAGAMCELGADARPVILGSAGKPPPAELVARHAPIDVTVCGRHDRRTEDDALVRYALSLGPRTSITFHLALDDALMAGLAPTLQPLLAALGDDGSEPISNAQCTKAIERWQARRSAA
ncbi:MAG: hypothetical protein AB7O31_05025 [Burkholderiales bacterium]